MYAPPPRVVTWNGKDVPPELRELPAGRYVVEAVEDEAPALSPEEEAGIEAALESYVKAASSTPSAPARSSTQPSGVEGHLHRRSGRRHRRRDHLSQRTQSDRCSETRRRDRTVHRTSGRRSRGASLATSLGRCRAELGRAAVPDLLSAPSRRTVDRARVPPGAPTHHAISPIASPTALCAQAERTRYREDLTIAAWHRSAKNTQSC